MPFMKGQWERLPIDPRIAQEIARNPQMLQEQGGSMFLQQYGGPYQYQQLAQLPQDQLLVYGAVIEGGATTAPEIEVMTGLEPKRVTSALAALQKKGLITWG